MVEELKNVTEENKAEEINADELKSNIYYGFRFIQIICIGVAVFGFLWEGTEQFNMSTPQFMIIYGSAGAAISEVIARIFKKKILK